MSFQIQCCYPNYSPPEQKNYQIEFRTQTFIKINPNSQY